MKILNFFFVYINDAYGSMRQEQPTKITNLSNSYLPLEIGNEWRYKCYTSFDDTFE